MRAGDTLDDRFEIERSIGAEKRKRRTIPSSDADATCWPSGLTATLATASA